MTSDSGKNDPGEEPKANSQEEEVRKTRTFLPTRVVSVKLLGTIAVAFGVFGGGLLNAQFFYWGWGIIWLGAVCGSVAGRLWVINHKIKHRMPDWLDSNWTFTVIIAICAFACFCAAFFSSPKPIAQTASNLLPQLTNDAESKPADMNPETVRLSTNSLNDVADVVAKTLKNWKASENSPNRFDKPYPGISFHFLMRLGDPIAGRSNFIWDFGKSEASNRASIFIDSENNLCFRVIGQDFSSHTLKVSPGLDTFNFGSLFYLCCEYGIDGGVPFLRMVINGREVAQTNAEIPIAITFNDCSAVMGADLNHKNGGVFDFADVMVYDGVLTDPEIRGLLKWMNGKSAGEIQVVHFSGEQWLGHDKVKM